MTDYGRLALKRIEELYLESYGRRAVKDEKTGAVCVTLNETEPTDVYKKELRFRTVSGARAVLSVSANLSDEAELKVTLDGEEVFSGSVRAGGDARDIPVSGLGAGVHSLGVELSGSGFTVNSLTLSVNGGTYEAVGDVFIEAFPSGQGYVKRELGKLTVYSLGSNGKPAFELDGISAVRTVSGDTVATVAVTETGAVILIEFAADFTPRVCHAVATGARAACAFFDGENYEVFVSFGGYLERYTLTGETCASCGRLNIPAQDLSATQIDGRVYIFSENGGYLSVNECGRESEFPTREIFAVIGKRED